TFKLTYDAGDALEAERVANKLAELFIQNASAKHEQKTDDAAKVIDDQLDALTKRIEQQSQKIHDYKTKTVHALPDHYDDNIRGIDASKEQVLDRETKISDERAKRASIEKELQDLEAKGVLEQPTVHERTPDEIKLDDLKLRLSELQTRYTPE